MTAPFHRPGHRDISAPAAPAGSLSTTGALIGRTYSELVWLLIQRRHALGMSQECLDHRIGWCERQTSKLEIPHRDTGRVAGPRMLAEWLAGLQVGIQLVPDENRTKVSL